MTDIKRHGDRSVICTVYMPFNILFVKPLNRETDAI